MSSSSLPGGARRDRRRGSGAPVPSGRPHRPLLLLLAVLAVVSFSPGASSAPAASRRPAGEPSGAPLPPVTAAEYTLSGAMFQSEQGETKERTLGSDLSIPKGDTQAVFVSGGTQAPIDFTDLAPHWSATVPDGTSLLIELRTGPDGRSWDDWEAVEEEDVIMAEDVVTETYASLISVGQGERTHRYVQTRVTLSTSRPDLSPVFHGLTYTFINAGITPNPPRPEFTAQQTPSEIPKPAMVTRKEWGSPQGESSPKWTPKYKRVTHITIHHTATPNTDTDYAARVRAIWYYHTYTRGWGDIGYNYVIDPNGVIYEGRAGGEDVEAGHAYPFNSGTMGVGMLGNFMTVAPSASAQGALINLLSWKTSERGIDPLATQPITGYTNCGGKITYNRPTIAGHRDYRGEACGRKFNTSTCPGDRLYSMLPEIRKQVVSEQPPLRANFTGHETPGNMEPGATLDVRLTVRNNGSLTWPAKGEGVVTLGYKWLSPDNKPIPGGWQEIRTALPKNVTFADGVALVAKVNAPQTPGHYALIWDMFREGQGWFADAGSAPLRVDVVVGRDLTDKSPPSSVVLPLSAYSPDPALHIRWAGDDDPKGSGIASYDIQFRTAPSGQWTDWKLATNGTEATFDGEDGYTYEFRSRARDAAGNVEDWPARADTYTTVDTRPPLLMIDSPAAGAHVQPGPLVVRGRTEPGAYVVVNDSRAEEANGVFTSTVRAEGRDFLIHVSASDPSGNMSRLEVTVQAAPKFGDVPLDSPASVAIEFLSDRGIVSGYGDGTFRPAAPVTRAQYAKMLVLTMRWTPIRPPVSRFTDVSEDSPLFPFVEAVAARGVMQGDSDGSFRPNANVTRAVAIGALFAASGRNRANAGTLFDGFPPGSWAATCTVDRPRPNVPPEDANYCGLAPASRADVSIMLYNLRQMIEDAENADKEDDHGTQ